MLKRESIRDWMKPQIAHSLPGRLRLVVPGLEFIQAERQDLAEDLAGIPGVYRVRITVTTSGVLLEYNPGRIDASIMLEQANMIIQKYAMTVYRSRHTVRAEESAELSMPVRTLGNRLAINAGALMLGNFVFKTAPAAGFLRKLMSIQALTSLGLSLPIARNAVDGLRKDLRPNADFLTVTSIVASLLLGNANSALMILALSDLAEMMTAYTIEKTRSSIKKMLSVEDGNVWKVNSDGSLIRCPIAQARPGDQIEVHTGEKILVDGVVSSGSAVVDQSAITGEFIPVERHENDRVFAGTVVKNGNIRIEADKVGDQTVVSRIIGMVEASELKKAPIQRYADRFSNYLVPLNFLLSLTVGLVTRNPQKALKMLVIDYSCGIKLSTATAFSAAINSAVKQGILIKGGAYIEQMSEANTVLLDKTGTITEGKPKVVSMQMLTEHMDEKTALAMAMAAEETSSHPLAGAILSYGLAKGIEIPAHDEVVTEVSRGSRTVVDGKTVRVGNLKYMWENNIHAETPLPDPGSAIANYVGVDREIVSVLFAMDSPRDNVRRMVNSLRYDGVGDIELLTGDMDSQAGLVADLIGADGYQAQLLPEQKAEAVLKLQTRGNGVVMVGDGINDAPALAYADVGISLGSKSTDIAIETSDVVISRDEPMTIFEMRRLSRETMRIVKQNFAMVIGINTVGLILGASSNISVMMSALLHNMSTILVVGNSLRLLFFSPVDS